MYKMSLPKALLVLGVVGFVTGVLGAILKQSLIIDPSSTFGKVVGPATFAAIAVPVLIWVQRRVSAGHFVWLRKK